MRGAALTESIGKRRLMWCAALAESFGKRHPKVFFGKRHL